MDRNGRFLAGKVHYELDGYVQMMVQSAQTLPEGLVTTDEYEWDTTERLEEEAFHERHHEINSAVGIAESLLLCLDADERELVRLIFWEKKNFAQAARLFPQVDEVGNIRLDENGKVKYRDHKWAQRTHARALMKMKAASLELPIEDRLTVTYHIPSTNPIGSLAGRIAHEQGTSAGHEARVLVRQQVSRSRPPGTQAS